MRSRLPDRRPSETMTTQFKGRQIEVTLGLDPRTMAPREVFATGFKEGTDMAHTLADACVVISIALQHGIEPGELAKSLGTVPGFAGDEPASLIGAILNVLEHKAPGPKERPPELSRGP